jgi:3-isopropylmalate/(R)-2-methylmalate dehydratase small subunit
MRPLRIHTGKVVPLDHANVDTDQIIPKQFLKRIERTGYGDFLFYDWRFQADGTPTKDFVLNSAEYHDGSILLARRNFGCGSSREHAAWALSDYGFRVVIATSFADIFFSNASKNGLLTIVLPEATVDDLFRRTESVDGYSLTVNLESLIVTDTSGWQASFTMAPFRQKCLLDGLDDIALTLRAEAAIGDYERDRQAPWLRSV